MASASVCFDASGNAVDCGSSNVANSFALTGDQQAASMAANGVGVSPDAFSMTNANWLPDTSTIDLPGQFSGIPGGAVSNGGFHTSDPSGINTVSLNPTVNPTPTGGYMSVLAQTIAAASAGFSTYVKGSPSVAVPAPKYPGSSVAGSGVTGATNWLMIGGVVAVGVVALVVLAKFA